MKLWVPQKAGNFLPVEKLINSQETVHPFRLVGQFILAAWTCRSEFHCSPNKLNTEKTTKSHFNLV